MQIASRQCLWSGPGGAGTVLVIRAGEGRMTAKLCQGTLAPGSDAVTVEWGDGAVESFPDLNGRTHTYARAKDYRVAISDDIAMFGYSSSYAGNQTYRDMIVELKRLGSKVTAIGGCAFNNCRNMRGVIELPNVTSIAGYAFGSTLGITDFILPSMTSLVATSFYCLPSATSMYADNVTRIDSRFWEYYGGNLVDMYIRRKTCLEIKAMSGFPFRAGAGVRFHGSDGIVLGDGTIIS